jgi:hypothetical protein
MAEPKIYCPRCEYHPVAEDRWSCLPKCGTSWHTFWTGGVCPGCGHAWQVTQCPVCHKNSPHKAWYHWPVDDAEQSSESREKKQPASA